MNSPPYFIKLKDSDGNIYSVREDTPYKVSTNRIYVTEEDPNILIKVLEYNSFPESPIEHEFTLNLVKNELKIAKMLSDQHFPVPHVFLTRIKIDKMHITGYIVMERIAGRSINTHEELEQYFDNIMEILNDLNNEGIVYNDFNIDNFILTKENEIFVLDFGGIERHRGIVLNPKFIKSALKKSIDTNAYFRGGKRRTRKR
jgi:tRNA A-37 threonylcarbamoyl transferase component Bud32